VKNRHLLKIKFTPKKWKDLAKIALQNINSVITDDDKVFIVKGKDEELYMVDDPAMIRKLELIFEEHNEAEALKIVLPMLNPKKYK
jgi:hypothetical protein